MNIPWAKLKHGLIKDTLILLGVQVTGYVLPLITLPYLGRVLGPTNFGYTAVGTALVLYFAVIIEYGFGVTGTRQIAVAQNDPVKINRVYGTIMATKLSLLVLCVVGMLALLATVPKFGNQAPLYLLSFMQAIGLCLSPNWILQGLQKMKYVAFSDYGAKIVSVFLIFLLVKQGSDYVKAAALQSGGYLIAALIGLTVLFWILKVRPSWPAWPDMKVALIEGWPVFLSMASMTLMTSSNTIILNTVASAAEVGYMNAAYRLIIASKALTNPITTAVYPHMSKLARNSPQEGLRFFRKQVLWMAAPFLVISLGMLVFSPLAVRIIYGGRFQESGVLLQIMSFTPVIHSVSMCFGTYYMLAYGFEKEWSKIITRMVILNFVVLGILLLILPPTRAVALTTTMMDLFSAGSCALFYRRTSDSVGKRSSTIEETSVPMATPAEEL